MYDLIFRKATVVDAHRQETADVAISGHRIAAVAPTVEGDAKEEINAEGLALFPGLIDAHVHFNEPGREAWEGFETGTTALASGGVTTFFDMPLNSAPATTTAAAFDEKRALADEKSLVNCYLWGGLVPDNLDQLGALHERGVIGFKAFMSDSGIDNFKAVDDFALYEGMKIIAELGQVIAVHAENDSITRGKTLAAMQAGTVSIKDYLASRPVIAELEAIQRAILLAGETGCKLHIVHVSTARGIDLVLEAQKQGVDVSCETCPHYLVLTEDDLERLGARAKCAPPLRSQAEVDGLWVHLLNGRLPMVVSDHSPSPVSMKEDKNFFKIWGGIASCQSTLHLMLTEGRKRGMSLPQISAVTSYNIAQRFGLTNKGLIAAGMDADVVLVDVEARSTLQAEDLFYRHKYSPYIGMELSGRVVRTVVGGRTVYN